LPPIDADLPEGPGLAERLFARDSAEDESVPPAPRDDEQSVVEIPSVAADQSEVPDEPPQSGAPPDADVTPLIDPVLEEPSDDKSASPAIVHRLPEVGGRPARETPPSPTEEQVDRTAPPPIKQVAPGDHWQALTEHALNGSDGPQYNTSAEALPPTGYPLDAEGVAPPQRDATWWSAQVPEVQREGSPSQKLDLATIVQEAIFHSEHIQAIGLEPQIRETEITFADAAFDPAAFIESKWNDLSDPVGNLLTTGGPPRLSREEWTTNLGLRRKIRTGGRFEIAQRLNEEDNNSVFFVPPNQATARLTVSLNQPLLKGGGTVYNRSLIVLAQHDTQVARDRFDAELEQRILEVVRAYWEL
jgi:hypothetical protein